MLQKSAYIPPLVYFFPSFRSLDYSLHIPTFHLLHSSFPLTFDTLPLTKKILYPYPDRLPPCLTAIDHLNALLAERTDLLERLQYARSVLPSNHPALIVPPQHMDPERGVALWEREWNGGTGMGMGGDDDD